MNFVFTPLLAYSSPFFRQQGFAEYTNCIKIQDSSDFEATNKSRK